MCYDTGTYEFYEVYNDKPVYKYEAYTNNILIDKYFLFYDKFWKVGNDAIYNYASYYSDGWDARRLSSGYMRAASSALCPEDVGDNWEDYFESFQYIFSVRGCPCNKKNGWNFFFISKHKLCFFVRFGNQDYRFKE